jgi:8-amino-7-oxononanoate synthase
VGSREITRFLVNFARPFIYSTACDLVALAFMREAYRMVQDASTERAALFALLEAMRELKREFAALQFVESESAIQGVIVPGNRAVVAAERALQEAGFQVKAIRSPTVPEGSERLRLSLHSYNTVEELRAALAVVQGLRLRGHGV